MQKMILFTAALLLITLASVGAQAQSTENKDAEKSKTTTVDAWRDALPVNEQPPVAPEVIADESRDNVESEEAAAQVEKRILDLENRLMEAVKKRDSVTLNHLLADDFMPVGASVAAAQPDKVRFIDSLKNSELKAYVLEKTTVRVYQTTAIVTVQYKQQAAVAGSPSDGNFIATDVWVKRGKRWQAVSRHVSQLPKP